jgi:hypothetical protein
MIRRFFLFLVILGFSSMIVRAQTIVSTSDLFKRYDTGPQTGKLNIIQDPALDTLLNRYILGFKNLEAKNNGNSGMEGFRIQIYRKNVRNAREESNAIRATFMSRFPDLPTYQLYQDPGYFIIRVGDFRTKTEATRLFVLINKEKEFKEGAYIVPDFINFPDKNTK